MYVVVTDFFNQQTLGVSKVDLMVMLVLAEWAQVGY
jgi:hypothetical protein